MTGILATTDENKMLYAKHVKTSNQNDSLSQIFNLIKPKSTVLDIGCATGGLAKLLVKQKQCKVFGLEQNPKSAAICQKAKIFTDITIFDVNKLTPTNFPLYKTKFDYVVCADVLEHLQKPSQTIDLLQKFLKKDGKMIISLPNVAHGSVKTNLLLNDFTYTEIGVLDKTHLHFYTYKSIAKLLSAHNLKIEQARAVYMPLDGWQPNKMSQLPAEIARFISQDKHSHIMQYIVLCAQSKASVSHNISKLQDIPTKEQKNTIFWQIKRFLVNKHPCFLKIIEKIRS